MPELRLAGELDGVIADFIDKQAVHEGAMGFKIPDFKVPDFSLEAELGDGGARLRENIER